MNNRVTSAQRSKDNRARKALLSPLVLLPLVPLTLCLLSQMAFAQTTSEGETNLFETGRAEKIRVPTQTASVIKIVSYNMRWRGGDDLQKLIKLFKTDALIGQAMILGLQEVDRNKKRTRNVNTARLMAKELGTYYAWAAPPAPVQEKKDKQSAEEETGVAILSAYPLTDVRRIVLPNEGPNGRRRVALGATIHIGQTLLRVYSVHAETRISIEQKSEQLRAVLDDLARDAKLERAIVLGDFNTWQADAERATTELFTNAKFSTPFDSDQPTWKTFLLKLKLDWIWLRGLDPINHGIDRDINLSDHWPLWVDVRLSGNKFRR